YPSAPFDRGPSTAGIGRTMDSTLETSVDEHAAGPRPAARQHNGVLRVALVGCGAIAKSLHLPVLAGHERIELVALVDRDVARAQEVARGYGIASVLADVGQIDPERVDAAIVATPPQHHAPATIDLLRRGMHVLVEKPMATSATDAEAM